MVGGVLEEQERAQPGFRSAESRSRAIASRRSQASSSASAATTQATSPEPKKKVGHEGDKLVGLSTRMGCMCVRRFVYVNAEFAIFHRKCISLYIQGWLFRVNSRYIDLQASAQKSFFFLQINVMSVVRIEQNDHFFLLDITLICLQKVGTTRSVVINNRSHLFHQSRRPILSLLHHSSPVPCIPVIPVSLYPCILVFLYLWLRSQHGASNMTEEEQKSYVDRVVLFMLDLCELQGDLARLAALKQVLWAECCSCWSCVSCRATWRVSLP